MHWVVTERGVAALAEGAARETEKFLADTARELGVWLLGGIGAWTGASGLLPVVLLASIQGTVVGLALIALGKSEPGPPELRNAITHQPSARGVPAADASKTHI